MDDIKTLIPKRLVNFSSIKFSIFLKNCICIQNNFLVNLCFRILFIFQLPIYTQTAISKKMLLTVGKN